LENVYINSHKGISDLFVYGDSLKSCLVAILLILDEDLKEIGKEIGLSGGNLS